MSTPTNSLAYTSGPVFSPQSSHRVLSCNLGKMMFFNLTHGNTAQGPLLGVGQNLIEVLVNGTSQFILFDHIISFSVA